VTIYRYEAAARSGQLVSGEMDALSKEAVIERLHGLGYVPIRADVARQGVLAWLPSISRTAQRSGRARELVSLTQQLSTLLQASLPLDRALEIAASVTTRTYERDRMRSLLDRVRSGNSLADALAAQDGFFPNFDVGRVRAGEASGSLDSTLKQLAELLERSNAAREHIKSGLTYPLIVLATGALSLGVLFGFVIPRFRPVFEDAGARLPTATRLILTTSDFFATAWWAIILVAIAAVGLFRHWVRTPAGRASCDRLLLRLPLLRDLILKIEIARFSRTLGTLIRSGLAPLAALRITVEMVTNTVLKAGLTSVMDSVKEGKGFSQPLENTALVPTLAVQLTRVGEETGRLDEMLLKIAEIYDIETQRSIDRLLSLLVPGVTVALGILVAVVMGSIVTAILGVYDLAL
jgi:general secretion pathway protein F